MKVARLVLAVSALASLAALAEEEEERAQPVDAPAVDVPVSRALRQPLPLAEEDLARERAIVRQHAPKTWADTARFFVGARTGVGVPPGGLGVAPTAGVEVGVSAESGIGFGLHFLSVWNPPDAPSLKIPKAQWGIGAAADMRWYFQTVRPLSLYPTLSVGFLAGPTVEGRNAVIPMFNPGFGARVRIGSVYTSFEFGVLGFQVPFVAVAFGWEPDRDRARQLAE